MAALAITVAGCSSTAPTRYYQMVPVTSQATATESPIRLLAVSRIQFPDYLDRPQIVSRASDTRLTVAEFDQWSEPLGGMFSNVLVENLRRTLGGSHVILLPDDRGFEPSLELDLNVLRFDVDSEGQIVLNTRWRLLDSAGKVLTTERTDLTEQATPADYGSITDGMSRAVGALAARIVMTLPAVARQAQQADGRRS